MVFLFGMDIPLVEVMAGIAVLLLIGTICMIFALFKEIQISKKLDALLKEEHQIKKELDIAEMEETQQLVLLKHVVNEIASLHGIRTKSVQHMQTMKELSVEANRLSPSATKGQHHDLMDKMTAQIARLDQIGEHETRQLAYINDIISRFRKR